jgi:hypothetical protein
MKSYGLPDPTPLGLVAFDGVPVPVQGWVHDGRAYLFATRRGPDGKVLAAVLDWASKATLHAWPCDTRAQALGIAAQEYSAAAFGTSPDASVTAEPVIEPEQGRLN